MVNSFDVAQALLEYGVPVVRCLPGLKRPYANSVGTWDSISDPDNLAGWLKQGDNLGALLGWEKESPVIAVGLDVYKTKSVAEFASSELGVSSQANCWVQRTGRGGYTVFYFYRYDDLERDTAGCGDALDLLTNGYSMIAPSDTSKQDSGGGPYTWLAGHSPLDIPMADLDDPPEALLTHWRAVKTPKAVSTSGGVAHRPDTGWLTAPIPEGRRNETLAKIAGYYHRKLPDASAVEVLVHNANATQCSPPLSQGEVQAVLNSILKLEGANHFRGVKLGSLVEVVR